MANLDYKSTTAPGKRANKISDGGQCFAMTKGQKTNYYRCGRYIPLNDATCDSHLEQCTGYKTSENCEANLKGYISKATGGPEAIED